MVEQQAQAAKSSAHAAVMYAQQAEHRAASARAGAAGGGGAGGAAVRTLAAEQQLVEHQTQVALDSARAASVHAVRAEYRAALANDSASGGGGTDERAVL